MSSAETILPKYCLDCPPIAIAAKRSLRLSSFSESMSF